MSRPENYLSALWFINNVMPLLNDLNIRFIVLGSKPSDELKNIKSDKVIITGFVDNIEAIYCIHSIVQYKKKIREKIFCNYF